MSQPPLPEKPREDTPEEDIVYFPEQRGQPWPLVPNYRPSAAPPLAGPAAAAGPAPAPGGVPASATPHGTFPPSGGSGAQPVPPLPPPREKKSRKIARTPTEQSRAGNGSIYFFLFSLISWAIVIFVWIMEAASGGTSGIVGFAKSLVLPNIIIGGALNSIGFILAIIGFTEPNKLKTTAVVGLMLNLLPCLGWCGLLVIGVAAAGAILSAMGGA